MTKKYIFFPTHFWLFFFKCWLFFKYLSFWPIIIFQLSQIQLEPKSSWCSFTLDTTNPNQSRIYINVESLFLHKRRASKKMIFRFYHLELVPFDPFQILYRDADLMIYMYWCFLFPFFTLKFLNFSISSWLFL